MRYLQLLLLCIEAPVKFAYHMFKSLRNIDAHKAFVTFMVQVILEIVLTASYLFTPDKSIVVVAMLLCSIVLTLLISYVVLGSPREAWEWRYIVTGIIESDVEEPISYAEPEPVYEYEEQEPYEEEEVEQEPNPLEEEEFILTDEEIGNIAEQLDKGFDKEPVVEQEDEFADMYAAEVDDDDVLPIEDTKPIIREPSGKSRIEDDMASMYDSEIDDEDEVELEVKKEPSVALSESDVDKIMETSVGIMMDAEEDIVIEAPDMDISDMEALTLQNLAKASETAHNNRDTSGAIARQAVEGSSPIMDLGGDDDI